MADVKNKVKFGLSNVHVAFMTDEQAGTYGEFIAIPGAVSLTADPEGSESKFYADNIPYFTITSNGGYTGSLEVALFPDAVLQQALGMTVDTNGMVVELADGKQKPFALAAEFDGDAHARRVIYYNCKLARPSADNSTTEDSVSVATESADWTAIPLVSGGRKLVKGVIEPTEANKAAYDAFFTNVLLPTFPKA